MDLFKTETLVEGESCKLPKDSNLLITYVEPRKVSVVVSTRAEPTSRTLVLLSPFSRKKRIPIKIKAENVANKAPRDMLRSIDIKMRKRHEAHINPVLDGRHRM
jgi:hypothetical protein